MSPAVTLHPFDIVARNLPEHAINPIHTDEGARAAGFSAALVTGVTSYAYIVRPLVVADPPWGFEWVASGTADVRLRRPVCADQLLTISATVADADAALTLRAADRPDDLVVLRAGRGAAEPGIRTATALVDLAPVTLVLGGQLGSTYAQRAGVAECPCATRGVVHPAVWPALANLVVHSQVAKGSWMHVRSGISHHQLAYDSQTATVTSAIIRRTPHPRGETLVVDVRIAVDGTLTAVVEHEVIVGLPGQ